MPKARQPAETSARESLEGLFVFHEPWVRERGASVCMQHRDMWCATRAPPWLRPTFLALMRRYSGSASSRVCQHFTRKGQLT
jgi:hypothetical protein